MENKNNQPISRRKFLKLAGGAASAALLTACGFHLSDVATSSTPQKIVPKKTIILDPLPTLVPSATALPTLTATPEAILQVQNQLGSLLGTMNKEWRMTQDTSTGVTKIGVDALTRPAQAQDLWYAPNEIKPTPAPFTAQWKNVLKINKDGTALIKAIDYFSSYHDTHEVNLNLKDLQYNSNLETLVVYDPQKNFVYRYNQVIGGWVDNRLQAGLPGNIDVTHIREVIPWINPELLADNNTSAFIAQFNKQMVALEKNYITANKIPVGNYDITNGPVFSTSGSLPFPTTRLVDEPKVSVVYCPALGADDHEKFIWGMVKDQASTTPPREAIFWHYVTMDNATFTYYSIFGEQKRFRENLSSRANLKQLILNKVNKSSATFFTHGSTSNEPWNKSIATDASKGWAFFLDLCDHYTAAEIDIYSLFNGIFADQTQTADKKAALCKIIQDNCWLPALDTATNLY